MEQLPVYKCVNRNWKTLPDKGDNVYIKDPKLKEGYIGDLSKKNIIQLEEILERQNRILNNKYLSSKLKDKGEKLRECRQKVVDALKKAYAQNEDYQNEETRTDIDVLEWKIKRVGEGDPGITNGTEKLDSDDDEEEREDRLDPLRLMAYHSSCVKKPVQSRNRLKDEDPADAIIEELKQLDLQDAKQPDASSCEFGARRNQMFEEMRKRNGPVKDSFKPFRPVENPEPIPGLVHHSARPARCSTMCIPQQESLRLERDFLIRGKERALMDAREQLQKRKTEQIGLPLSSVLRYRDANQDKHLLDSENEDEDDSLSYVSDSFDLYADE